jgi:predicted metal-dependent HD superfamily phosphohydrolase
MTQPETEIRSAWRQIIGHHHDGYVDDLLIRYAEPHRRYHTAAHIMWVVRHLHDMAPTPSAELLAAALYHDAIYDPKAAENEARSAVIAATDLARIGWPIERCATVQAMIVATAGHVGGHADGSALIDQPNSAETAMLLDADLAILGAEPGAYQAYVTGVRAEYAHVDDDTWRTGRAQVLRHFIDRRRLFTTEYMYTAREHRARANIDAELAALK